ncbi:MAG: type II toxin-antitoxin system VapC family toxin [Actinomycetota bacterium]
MILDSSAIIAMLLQEPGHERIVDAFSDADAVGAATPTLLETSIVLTARAGDGARLLLSRLVEAAAITPISFGQEHWRVAADAYARFGKGRHPAALNFGDCMSYATARLAGMPLLCTGRDFARTDIALVLRP